LSKESLPKLPKQLIASSIAAGVLVGSSVLGGALPAIATPAEAVDPYPLFHEVWKIVDDNFFDGTYNHNDWARLKTDYEGIHIHG